MSPEATPLRYLETENLAVVVDASCGDIRSIRSPYASEVLFQAPWSVEDVVRGSDDTAWVRGWQGGWSLLFPNAGPACDFEGDHHPYHGDVSARPWQVVEVSQRQLRLRIQCVNGIAAERTVEVADSAVTVDTILTNQRANVLPYLFVEHVILGQGVAGPRSAIRLPSGTRNPLDRASSPGQWDTLPPGPGARFGSIENCQPRGLDVDSDNGTYTLAIDWHGDDLDHLWYWWEDRATTAQPWSSRTTCLGLEPASCAAAGGLHQAVTDGDAQWIEPGETRINSVTLSVLPRA